MSRQNIQIAIDGPAGAGKSTIAQAVAKRLNLFYLDTGAMYRAVAYAACRRGVALDNEDELAALIQNLDIVFDHAKAQRVWCNGEDVTAAIRSPEVSRAVSAVAAYPKVRNQLVRLQQAEAKRGDVVMDGRDIGTLVMPEAALKIFLTASPAERARRRWQELTARGENVDLDTIARDMAKRDELDSQRKASPLKPAEDALIIDTTGKPAAEIVEKIITLAKERI